MNTLQLNSIRYYMELSWKHVCFMNSGERADGSKYSVWTCENGEGTYFELVFNMVNNYNLDIRINFMGMSTKLSLGYEEHKLEGALVFDMDKE